MKKLNNPYAGKKNYNCFACSPDNEIGLQLDFYVDGGEVVSMWEPRKCFEGYHNILHGGIQTVLLDEIAAWTVNIKCKTGGVTKDIKAQFKKPVYLNRGKITIRGKILEIAEKLATVSTFLYDGENQLCSEAVITYYLFPEKIAKKKYGYPGIEAFLD